MRHKARLLIAFACGIFFLAGCSLGPPPPLRVGAGIWPGFEPLFIARELGFYKGQPLKLVEYTSTSEVVRAFKHGALEAIALTGDELIRLSREEPGLKAVALLDISHGADALIAKPSINSLSELKGKRIGVEVNGVGIYLLVRALQHGGLQLSDVQVVSVANYRHAEEFSRGELDAVVTFEPNKSMVLEKGGRVLFDSSRIEGEIMDFLVVKASVVNERKEELKLLLEGWYKATAFMVNSRPRAAEISARREGITPQQFLKALEQIRIPGREQSRSMMQELQVNPSSALQKLADLMLSTGLITNRVESASLISLDII